MLFFELMALAKPTIFIPLPKKESRGDQIQNAKYFYKKKYVRNDFARRIKNKPFIRNIKKTRKKRKKY